VQAAIPSAGFIESDGSGMLLRRIMKPFELLTARFGFGLFVSSFLLNWEKIQSARVMVATTDSTGIPLLLLKRAGILSAKVVLISQGLHSLEDDLAHLPWATWLTESLYRCLPHAAALVALGDGDEVAIRTNCSRVRLPEVITIQFGIDENFWRPAAGADTGDGGFVVSVGSDRLRDYPTLVAAIGETPLKLVTRLDLPPEAARPTIEKVSKLSWPELRSLYQQSRFVVTPVKDQPRDSGHSATLQAMACGKAVILSDTAGMWDRENMKHGETCWLVEPGNKAAMRDAIAHLWSHPEEAARIGANARRLLVEKYTSAGFGTHLAQVVQKHMGSPTTQGRLL